MAGIIPCGRHGFDEDDIQALVAVPGHGYLTQGAMVEAFEQAVAESVGVKYAVAVASGTAACVRRGRERVISRRGV